MPLRIISTSIWCFCSEREGARATKMLRRLAMLRSSHFASPLIRAQESFIIRATGDCSSPFSSQFKISSRHFIDLHQMGNKEAIEKEKARLVYMHSGWDNDLQRLRKCAPWHSSDELSRGYFADISEIRKNGGKIAMANKTLIPYVAAVKFPDLEANLSDGSSLTLPIASGQSTTDTTEKLVPLASLLCLSFRASSQRMAESWSVPFVDAFNASAEVQVYEVSFIDSWLLSLGPVRQIFLKMMKKSAIPQRQIVYSFGDHYDLRKKLQILNLLTGYIFLLDRFGRIRWQGFGLATDEELSSLLSCTSVLLEEK